MRQIILIVLIALLVACQSPNDQSTPTTAPAATQPSAEVTNTPPPPTVEATVATAQQSAETVTDEPTPAVESAVEPPVALASGLTLREVAGGFTQPTYLTHAGGDLLYVVEQPGVVSKIADGKRQEALFLDIESRVGSSANEQGLLALAFHPNFTNNGRLFVYYTDLSGAVVVSEFAASAESADPNSERILLTVPQPYRNHNGGALEFGPDGYLYIGLGDGGAANDPDYNGLDRSTLLGSILRIDVDGGQPFAVPADNPFVNEDGARDEIWAWGLRNPWRISFDAKTGDLFIADVGQNKWEEVSWQSAESSGGENYGWNAWEGTHCFTNECDRFADAVQPIIEYDHSQGCSITGGYVYRGAQSAGLVGNYLFGDFCSGKIWGAVSAENGWQTRELFDADFFISSFGVDAQGELYALDFGNGVVYQISAE